ncbi:hypothetical protein V6N13_023399 [Hibiscus sabdariffa]|uniref:Uncharacterized protein n=1 Tax=Hibiscus sabdariffa TaxID=183260 RepID=A0ABR2PLM5_9ROSI
MFQSELTGIDDDYDTRSGTEMDAPSGDEQDIPSQRQKRKRYHQHALGEMSFDEQIERLSGSAAKYVGRVLLFLVELSILEHNLGLWERFTVAVVF